MHTNNNKTTCAIYKINEMKLWIGDSELQKIFFMLENTVPIN